MKRRILFARGAAAAAATTVLAAPAVAQATPDVRWRLSSAFPRTFDALFGPADLIARQVAAMTDNKFQIRVFPAGEIVPPFSTLDAAQNGTVEATHVPNYYFIGKDPTLAFETALPFGMTYRQHNAWYYHGGGQALLRDVMKEYNVVSILAGNTGAQMGGFFRKELRTSADLQGLKFRIAGLGGQIMAKLGATPQQLALGEVYSALERGTIDAAEFVGPYDDERLGLVRVAPYYYFPGFWEASAALSLNIHLPAWEALPSAYKAALESACAHANADMVAKYDAVNAAALRRLVAAGAQLRPFPREIMAEAWKAAHAIYDETAQANPKFARVYEHWKAFRDEQFLWFRVAELSYANFAFTAAQTVR
ncbi:TRAP transporter substrate-binding protein [Elioraea rosea]|uniref:TRAP transporter substrate-binding protein n=1 Tax=Elioraea rosea TaxID=2492390 RepID=UPI0011833897|nr:TRAP transporter substrate-binding protein DctP [Elioraea rosea]